MRNKIFSYVMIGAMVIILGISTVLLAETEEKNYETASTNIPVASSTIDVATAPIEIATKISVATPIATCSTILEPEKTEAVIEEVSIETSTTVETTEEIVKQTVIVQEDIVIEETETREYYVYKPSTHYIHKSTCHWVSSECYEIEDTSDIEARACSECQPELEIINPYIEETTTIAAVEEEVIEEETTTTASGLTFVKTFSRGTYYAYGGARTGGSGRSLIDCSYGNGIVKGSIASSYLYRNYGYNYNGNRTMVYLEISGYPSMNGYYYLDDSDAGNSNVIDFFYISGSNCIFRRQGVVSVDCYLVN